jgi:hypothetical protein
VGKAEKIVEQMLRSPQNVRFDDLAKVCTDHFGEPRQDATLAQGLQDAVARRPPR